MTFQIKIEEFDPSIIKKDAFYLPPIPWQWTLLRDGLVITFGYCHTQEQANDIANKSLNFYR